MNDYPARARHIATLLIGLILFGLPAMSSAGAPPPSW